MRGTSFCAVLQVGLLLMCASSAAAEETWLPAVVDHIDQRYTALVYTDENDNRYVRQIDLGELGIPAPGQPGRRHANEWYYPFDELPLHEIYIDDINERVHFVERERPHVEAPPSRDLLLDVTVNGRNLEEPLLLHFENGDLDLSQSALQALGIDEARARLLLKERENLPLHAIAGERFALNYAALTLDVSIPPELLLPRRITVRQREAETVEPTSGVSGLLSYAIASRVESDGERSDSALVNASIGAGTTLCSTRHVHATETGETRRLDSRCVLDRPEAMMSVAIGDSVMRPGAFGHAVRFGGLHIGTDYGLSPSFSTQPRTALIGTARVPSTLEIWVDQMLMRRQDIPPGVFELSEIPVHTGAGEIRAVIDNAVEGRQVIRESFYSDPALLAEGLVDWSLAAGYTREDFGLETDNYADRASALDLRVGVTDWLTLQPRIEASDDMRVGGLSAAFRLGQLGLVELSRAASEGDGGVHGNLAGARYSRRGQYVNLFLAHQRTDQNFVQLGSPFPGDAPKERSQAGLGFNFPAGVSLSLGGIDRVRHDGERQRFYTGGLNLQLGQFGSMLLTAMEPREPEGERLFTANVTMSLGDRSNARASVNQQGGTVGRRVGVQRNLARGSGLGYSVQVGQGNGRQSADVSLQAQGDWARLRIDGQHLDGDTRGEARLSGGVVFSGHGVSLSRWERGSAALVQLPASGVRIYHDEQVVAVSNRNGSAVIPGLRPYQVNNLRLEPDDLPMDADFRDLERSVTPGRRHAVAVDFDISRSRHLSAHLRLASASASIPPGAQATIRGHDTAHPVGFEGLIYMPAPDERSVDLDVEWPQGSCEATLVLPDSPESMIELGDVICE